MSGIFCSLKNVKKIIELSMAVNADYVFKIRNRYIKSRGVLKKM